MTLERFIDGFRSARQSFNYKDSRYISNETISFKAGYTLGVISKSIRVMNYILDVPQEALNPRDNHIPDYEV